MPAPIHFFNLKPCPSLRERNKLRSFLPRLFKAEKKTLGNLTYIFCSDDYLLEINKTYLRHDYYTDIITFNLSADPRIIEAEIYVSVDRVRDNALKQQVSTREEIHRVVFHGALHLCGYKDKTKLDKEQMTRKEDKYLKLYL